MGNSESVPEAEITHVRTCSPGYFDNGAACYSCLPGSYQESAGQSYWWVSNKI